MKTLLTFLQFLQLEESAPWHRPWFENSQQVKRALDSFDPNDRNLAKNAIYVFKEKKDYNPGVLVQTMNDHKDSPPSRYYHVHLIHGRVVLVYYHGGEYIILMDIVPHKIYENLNQVAILSKRLDKILPRMIQLTKQKMELAKTRRRAHP